MTGLNKTRAPAAFVLSAADLNPTLIVSHYKEAGFMRCLPAPRNIWPRAHTREQTNSVFRCSIADIPSPGLKRPLSSPDA